MTAAAEEVETQMKRVSAARVAVERMVAQEAQRETQKKEEEPRASRKATTAQLEAEAGDVVQAERSRRLAAETAQREAKKQAALEAEAMRQTAVQRAEEQRLQAEEQRRLLEEQEKAKRIQVSGSHGPRATGVALLSSALCIIGVVRVSRHPARRLKRRQPARCSQWRH